MPGFTVEKSINEYKFNEMYHKVEFYLDNSGDFSVEADKKELYHINPAAVLNLSITDTLYNWVVDGSMTFMYMPEDALSQTATDTGNPAETATAGAGSGKTIRSYQFRNDGFDLLRVMVVPNTYEDGTIKINQNDPKWILSYLFSVYDIEDVNELPILSGPLASYTKCFKIRFRDVRYQILQTTNIEWSTATSPNVTQNQFFANKPVLKTGQAIKELFEEGLTKPERGGDSKLFEFPSNEEHWNYGITELFYTSPASYSVLDDINYVFSHHVSDKKLEGLVGDIEVHDMCLLHTERPSDYSKLEQICLTPLQEFFKKAGKEKNSPGELQVEHFFVTSHTEETSMNLLYRAPMGQDPNSSNRDVKTFKYGQIMSYSFVDMSAEINAKAFNNCPVYSVDIGKREFNIQFKANDVQNARKLIAENYIKELYVKDSDREKLFLPAIHEHKRNINMFPVFSLNGDNVYARERNGMHQLLYTGLFQNACICFKTFGLTLRGSGTFIGIDKVGGCTDTDYNNKLYGQWFVVRVDHIFEAGTHMNYIYAIKTHRFALPNKTFPKTL